MSGTTTGGIRYPDSASRASDLGTELQRMAEDIERKLMEDGESYFKGWILGNTNLDTLATGLYWIPGSPTAVDLDLPGVPFAGPLEIVRSGTTGEMVWRPLSAPPQVWRVRRNSTGWGDWYPDAPRAVELTLSDTDWDALPDGDYFSHVAGVRTALGLPAQVGWVQKRTGGGSYGIATMQEWAPPYKRWISRHATTGWQPWEPDTAELTTTDRLKLEDTPGASQIMLELDHYGDGSGASSGAAYGLDIQNFPGARQALVIHQYSDNREAVRIDNTDGEAAVYINNTENLNINPGNTAAGAPFLKLHPYNMGNFIHYAYLMDDLTWLNDTDKTWSFQSRTGNVVEFKNAAGAAVGHVSQDGVQLRDTGWRNIQSLVTGYLTGKIACRRVGATVEIAAESLQVSGTGTFDFTDPLGAGWSPSRPLYTKGSDYWSDSVAATVRVWTDGKMRGQFGSVVDPKVHFQFVYTTTDAWPSTLPGTPA
ncbi:MAG: hypothetical protein ACTHYT_09955 [Agrococcus casei]|uniref:hypothetical protein n=1 Tax=Agrococcus casei TaxID=343512 RepID=UPI003F8F2161